MRKASFFQIAAVLVVIAVLYHVFAPTASATIVKYNRDYTTYQSYPDNPAQPDEAMEAYTAAFTNSRVGDSSVASNSALDLAEGLTPTVISGSVLGGSGPADLLTNGAIGTVIDSPGESYVFGQGVTGKLGFDLGLIRPIGQINTYSWHVQQNDGRRSMQKYELYASDGAADLFVATDETTPGWVHLASVNCYSGYQSVWADGQYGVSVQPDSGTLLGNYQYFIFVISSIGAPGGMGDNALYQEVDIVRAVPETSTLAMLAAGLLGLTAYAWRKRK